MRKCFVFVFMSAVFVARLGAADLTGSWTLEFQTDSSADIYRGECAFKQEGDRLSGSCGSGQTTPVPVRGSVEGRSATFQFLTGLDAGFTATFSGQVDEQDASMRGSWRYVDQEGNKGEGKFTAMKH